MAEEWSNLYTRIPSELRSRLDDYVKDNNTTVTYVVRRALENYLRGANGDDYDEC